MNKTLEKVKEMLEEELKTLTKKGDIAPDDMKVIKEAVCTIKMIDGMGGIEEMSGEYSEGIHPNWMTSSYGVAMPNYSGTNRSPVTGRYISHGTMPDRSNYSQLYGDNTIRGYSGHSIHDRMVAALEPMYDQATSEHERLVVSNTINRIKNEQ